jgi:hypothetical protein
LERVALIVGRGNILERAGKNSPMYYWQLANGVAADFLHRIYPHLIVKPRQARIGMYVDSLTYYRGGQKPERKHRTDAELSVLSSLWERNKACNHFGNPDLSDVPEPAYGGWRECERYFYDAEAVKEAGSEPVGIVASAGVQHKQAAMGREWSALGTNYGNGTRNRRTVWTVATQAFSEAHFAVYPEKLIEPCILAGTSEKGCCPECGKPTEVYSRIVGYMRPVSNWNPGKQQEFKERREFVLRDGSHQEGESK